MRCARSGVAQQSFRIRPADLIADQFPLAGAFQREGPAATQALSDHFRGGIRPIAFQALARSAEAIEVSVADTAFHAALGTHDSAIGFEFADPAQVGAGEMMNQLLADDVNGATGATATAEGGHASAMGADVGAIHQDGAQDTQFHPPHQSFGGQVGRELVSIRSKSGARVRGPPEIAFIRHELSPQVPAAFPWGTIADGDGGVFAPPTRDFPHQTGPCPNCDDPAAATIAGTIGLIVTSVEAPSRTAMVLIHSGTALRAVKVASRMER